MLIRYVDFANTPDQFQTRMGPQPTFQFSVWCCRTVMRLAKPNIPTDTWSVVVHRRTVVLNRSFLVHSQFQLKLPPNPMAQTANVVVNFETFVAKKLRSDHSMV